MYGLGCSLTVYDEKKYDISGIILYTSMRIKMLNQSVEVNPCRLVI